MQGIDPETGNERVRFENPFPQKAAWLAFSPDGTRLLVSSAETNSVHVWDLRLIRSEARVSWGSTGTCRLSQRRMGPMISRNEGCAWS